MPEPASMDDHTDHRVERVLEWYEKDPGDALVGEEEITRLGLDDLRSLFQPDDDDPEMLLVYEVEPHEVERLQAAVEHRIDLGAYDYFVAAYLRASDAAP